MRFPQRAAGCAGRVGPFRRRAGSERPVTRPDGFSRPECAATSPSRWRTKHLRSVLTSPTISLSQIPGNGSSATLSTRAQRPSSNETSSPVVVSLGHQSAPVASRRRKSSHSSWKLKMGSTISSQASRVSTSILPCVCAAISQNDRRAALFFGIFATSCAGTVVADERTVPHEDELSTEDSSCPP
jgi:hypothetical protein